MFGTELRTMFEEDELKGMYSPKDLLDIIGEGRPSDIRVLFWAGFPRYPKSFLDRNFCI
jgi:hypothetical protein